MASSTPMELLRESECMQDDYVLLTHANETVPMYDLIDGRLSRPSVGLGVMLQNANTGEILSEQLATDMTSVDRALGAAVRVHESRSWINLPKEQKSALLKKVSEELVKYQDEMGRLDAINTGVIQEMTTGINSSISAIFADAAEQVLKFEPSKVRKGEFGSVIERQKPWGPTVVLGPWNVPGATVAPKVAAALVAGNPVVLKASEWAPFATDLIAKAFVDAKFPAGVFQLVHGGAEVGAKLVSDPRVKCIQFTGSFQTAEKIAESTFRTFKPVLFETGGVNPMLVLKDADVDVAVQGLLNGLTLLNGQWCAGPSLVMVHDSLYDQFLSKALARLGELKVGVSTAPGVEMGPLANVKSLTTVQSAIEKLQQQGCTIHTPTPLPSSLSSGGYFVSPAIATNGDYSCLEGEIFGPVCLLTKFSDELEAVKVANKFPILMGYVFSKDTDRALHLGQEYFGGLVMINNVTFGFSLADGGPEPSYSFFGGAGYGADGSFDTMLGFFTGRQVVGING